MKRVVRLQIAGKGAKISSSMGEGVALLLIGGEGPRRALLEPVLSTVACTVAADSGFDLALELGLEPDLLVGDLDSIARTAELERFPRERIRQYSTDKDETDAEIGLRLLGEMGFGRVIIGGGGGGRLDHLLALVNLFERGNPPQAWYTSKEHIQLVEGELVVIGCKGQTVSFFPLGAGARGMSSRGLKWPLDGLQWSRGDMGVSNLFSEDNAAIFVREGRLLMVRTIGDAGDA